jgi:hypothetical protein
MGGRTLSRLALLVGLFGCVSTSRKVAGFGDLQPTQVVRSGQRPVVRGAVVRLCPIQDVPVASYPMALFRDDRPDPIGSTSSGPDGTFVLTSDFIGKAARLFIEAGGKRFRLEGSVDGIYEFRLTLDCESREPFVPAHGELKESPGNPGPPGP